MNTFRNKTSMIDNSLVEIISFDISHQPGVDDLLASISEEYEASFFSTDSKKISEVFAIANRKYWVAIVDEMVVGTVGIICENDYAILKSMFLHKAYRGQDKQVSLRLLQKAMHWAAQKKCQDMYLGTMSQFMAAQKFYEKQGFIEINESELPENFQSNIVDVVFYKKDISSYKP